MPESVINVLLEGRQECRSVNATGHPSQPLHLRVVRQLIPFALVRPAAEKRHSDLMPLKAGCLSAKSAATSGSSTSASPLQSHQ